MRHRRFGTANRGTALLALSALTFVVLGATMGFAADPDAAGEPCMGCAGCEAGECGHEGENPLTSHHHCCTTCCMSHAPLALPAVLASPTPWAAEQMPVPAAAAVLPFSAEPLYHPPRV